MAKTKEDAPARPPVVAPPSGRFQGDTAAKPKEYKQAPVPFCQRHPKHKNVRIYKWSDPIYYVVCDDCGCCSKQTHSTPVPAEAGLLPQKASQNGHAKPGNPVNTPVTAP